jgi:hypothetical protein
LNYFIPKGTVPFLSLWKVLRAYSRETSRPKNLALAQSKMTRIRLRAVNEKEDAVSKIYRDNCRVGTKTYC